MTWLMTALWFLSCYGLANAIAVLKFGKWIRDWLDGVLFVGTMVKCPACIGFWIGAAVSLLVFSPSRLAAQDLVFAHWGAWAFMDGCAASGLLWLLHVVASRLDVEQGPNPCPGNDKLPTDP